jgi:tRNA(Ile)-lysidine synthase
VNDLASHVESSVAAKSLIRDGQRILAAVSGGVDSMVLLAVLHELSKKHRWKLTVAHFNHQLRGQVSDADEHLVRKTARKLKLPFVVGRADVKAFGKERGLSVEMASRELRHDFLAATAAKFKIPTIALAHHADDQVELFFLRLLRGSGGEGLAGMKWSSPSPVAPKIRLARPLLDLSKTALKNFAKANKIPFSEDATNASIDFQRNRVRHELIPLLVRHYQPALGRAVLRVMDIVGADAEFAAQAAREWLKKSTKPGFDQLPPALQRRIVQQQLIDAGMTPEFELVERLRLHACQWISVGVDCAVRRERSGLVRRRQAEELPGFDLSQQKLLLSRGQSEAAFAGLKIRWKIADDSGTNAARKRPNLEYFDADKVGSTIWLRCWRPGDRFQPIGMGSARKLQDLFTNLKVPAAERRRRVVAATQKGELFWVEGLRMAEKFKLDENTRRRLHWSWSRKSADGLS